MKRNRKDKLFLGCLLILTCCLTGNSVLAQPLVTGNLSVYYDFDSFVDVVPDESGNGLDGVLTFGRDGFDDDANGDGLIDIRLSNEAKRGAGAVLFDTDPAVKEDRIELCQPLDDAAPRYCGDVDVNLIPSEAITVAAWVKLQQTTTDQDHSVFQSRSLDSAFSHYQVQWNGRLRMATRGQSQATNIVATNVFLDGSTDNAAASVPWEEWFHYAATYDLDTNTYGLYYNGQEIAGGVATGAQAPDTIGDWGQGAMIGMVPDFNRQLVGLMDEFYLFTRALSAAEIQQLVNFSQPVAGDFDNNGLLEANDIDLLSAEVRAGTNKASFDVTGDNLVNQADRVRWVNELKKTYFGDSNLDGVFNSSDFVQVFTTGEYEDATAGNSGWADGDWSGDQEFSSSDFVDAFQAGGYELGPRPAVVAVPEPSAIALGLLGLITLFLGRRR